MPLSIITGFTPIPNNSDAVPELWNSRFQVTQENIDSVNNAAGVSALSLAGWDRGSITTKLDTSNGTLSVLTIGAASGNTISTGTWGLSASTVTMLHGITALQSVGTVQAYSGNTVSFLAAISANTLVPQSGNTITIPSHLSMGNKRIENVGEPSNTSDVASKHYVDVNAGALTYRVDGATYNTTSNSSVTLSVATLPAAALVATGDTARVTMWGDGTVTASGVLQTQVYLGGSALGAMSLAAAAVWRMEIELERIGASSVRANYIAYRGAAIVSQSETTVTETLANALPIWLQTWNSSGLNTVTANAFCLKVEALRQ